MMRNMSIEKAIVVVELEHPEVARRGSRLSARRVLTG